MRPDSPQWIAAKAEGDRAELAIAAWFRDKRGWETYKALGRTDFDLLLQCQVEVKHDLQAPKTDNVAIETAYRGQPSGIITSKATWWVIVADSSVDTCYRQGSRIYSPRTGGVLGTAFRNPSFSSQVSRVDRDRVS